MLLKAISKVFFCRKEEDENLPATDSEK